MKLVEILVRDFEEWPKDARVKSITQDNDRAINLYSTDRPTATKCGGCWKSEGFIEYLTRSNTLATDHATAIVTREMWQAERERIAKPGKKANADEWIRHRGGKCPVDAGAFIDVRYRDGNVDSNINMEQFRWDHDGGSVDIMAYRIHKPAEQWDETECVGPFPVGSDDSGIKVDIDFPSGVIHIDGPLAWRDRIREIDRTVEALEEERVSLIQRLEGEGFKLIDQVNAKIAEAAQAHEDMSDWRNWKVGDLVEYVGGNDSPYYMSGVRYPVEAISEESFYLDDEDDGHHQWTHSKEFVWHSRSSA